MVWLNLLVLGLVSSFGNADLPDDYEPPRGYLIYATEADGFLKFYKTSLELKQKRIVLTINTDGKAFDKMYLDNRKNGEFLYWNYKNSSILGRFDFSTGEKEEKDLTQKFGTLLPVGYGDKICFYDSDNKTFTVYDFQTDSIESQFVISEETDMHCVYGHRRYKELLYFLECTETGNNTVKLLDISQKEVLSFHRQELRYCYDFCGISPKSKEFYASRGRTIYFLPNEGSPVELYIWSQNVLQAFAVGNDKELYFATEENGGTTIYKSIQRGFIYYMYFLELEENVKALTIHEE